MGSDGVGGNDVACVMDVDERIGFLSSVSIDGNNGAAANAVDDLLFGRFDDLLFVSDVHFNGAS